jgi:hypothetical protein
VTSKSAATNAATRATEHIETGTSYRRLRLDVEETLSVFSPPDGLGKTRKMVWQGAPTSRRSTKAQATGCGRDNAAQSLDQVRITDGSPGP